MTTPPAAPRWNLDDLVPGSQAQALDNYLSQLNDSVGALEATRTMLSPGISATDFLDILHRYEAMSKIAGRLKAYAYLWFAEDTQNPAALNLRSRLEHTLTDLGNRTLFLSLWFKSLSDAEAERLMKGGARDFLFDLSDVAFMSSAGLVALHSIAIILRGEKPVDPETGWATLKSIDPSRVSGVQKHIKLLGLQERVADTFENAGFLQYFESFSDVQKAVASF